MNNFQLTLMNVLNGNESLETNEIIYKNTKMNTSFEIFQLTIHMKIYDTHMKIEILGLL